LTQKYGFEMIELSSTSGVNLDFLITHIINMMISEGQHKTRKSVNVIEYYEKEHNEALDRLVKAYEPVVFKE